MWILTVEVLGVACLPLLRAFFDNRRDAALLSRPVGLALAAYLGWALSLSKILRFDRGTLILAVALIGASSFFVWRSRRRAGATPEPLFALEEKRAALFFWLPTAVFLAIRAAVPEVLGAEKFMDLAFFNSLTRFGAMPPADPWMSGYTINYYYWGYLLAAALAKISAVPTFVSYNFAVATFAGYSFVAAACLGLRLSGGRWLAGAWAGVGAVFGGNLAGALDAWHIPFTRDFDYWHASRVIAAGKTINEFPFFTFFHADLHPHLLAFPFFIAAFAAAHRYMEIEPRPLATPWKATEALQKAWPLFLLSLLAGTARGANNWNLPAMGLLFVFVGVFRVTQGRRLPRFGEALWGALVGIGILLLSLVLWLPYTKSYELETQGLGKTTMKSDLLEFLGVWGILLAAGYAGLLSASAGSEEDERSRARFRLVMAVLAFASLLAAFFARAPALVVILPLGLLAFWIAVRALKSPEGNGEDLFASFLVILALAMVAGCEFIYFKDNYGQDLQRMNTIFKFYHQAWPLLAIGVAVFGERAWRERAGRGVAVRATLAAAMALSLFYPIEAAVSRLRQHEGSVSLDLRAALTRRNSGDAEAIAWLEGHAAGGSVVLEATENPYSEYSRISSHTGIPTVLGWANHEGLWRRSNDSKIAQRVADEIARRGADVKTFYTTTDSRTAEEILRKYRVTHVVVGDLERRSYPAADSVGTFSFLKPALSGATAIYQVAVAP
jgi:YYY domain-containing protein